MTRLLPSLRLAIRVTAILLLLVGIALWSGSHSAWRQVHLALGALLGVLLVAIGVVAMRLTGRAGALLLTVVWTVVVMGYGIAQARLWPGSSHWIAQLVHVLLGLASIGVAERVAADARRATV